MKKYFLFFLLMSGHAFAGGADAGGGDWIRSAFLEMGNNVMGFLANSKDGIALTKEQKLNLKALKATLDINKVSVTDKTLVDRTGSVVDALVNRGKVQLNDKRWTDLLAQQRDLHRLVFHEMLRLADYDDDNYVISKKMESLAAQYPVYTKSYFPRRVNNSESISTLVTVKEIALNGSGCKIGDGEASAQVSPIDNSINIYSDNYMVKAGPTFKRENERLGCNLAISLSVQPGYRLAVLAGDVYGEAKGDAKSTVNASAEVFLAGEVGPKISGEFKVNDGLVLLREGLAWKTECGAAVNFRVNMGLALSAASQDTTARISRVKILTKLEKCTQ
jgi:hypothetical protein